MTVNDAQLALRIRTLRGQGVDPERRYYFPVTGYNFRLTNVACALLCAQLERKEIILSRRRKIFDDYRANLAGIPGIGLQPVAGWATPAPWLFCVTVDREAYGRSRDDLMEHLHENGVETRPFFIPLHTLPPFRQESARRKEALPITERVASCGMNLPTHSGMTSADVGYVCSLIKGFSA